MLRQILASDIGSVFKGLSHPDVIKHYGVSYSSLEATQEQMKFYTELEENDTGLYWAICSAQNSCFYGVGGLNGVSKEHKKAELGFWLFPEYWGKGIMKEATTLIINYGFNQLHLHRIEGFVETTNENCKKALSKLNFTHEGTMKDCEIKNGKFISLDIFALLTPQ